MIGDFIGANVASLSVGDSPGNFQVNCLPVAFFRWSGQMQPQRNCNIVSSPFCDVVNGVIEPVVLEFGGTWNTAHDPFAKANLRIGKQLKQIIFTICPSDAINDPMITEDQSYTTPFAIVQGFQHIITVDGQSMYTCALLGQWHFKDTVNYIDNKVYNA